MELPGEQFVRDLRAEIGAVHMLTCGLAFAASDKVDMQSDASPDKQREMLTVPMRFTTTVDGQVRAATGLCDGLSWFGSYHWFMSCMWTIS